MRSLIQLAGRVKRHRDEPCMEPNIHVFQTNLKALEHPGQPAFCRPGFESSEWPLDSHDLHQLLEGIDLDSLDARPRIRCADPSDLQPRRRLVDLEHARLLQTMQGRSPSQPAQAARKGPWARAAAPQPPVCAASWWQLPSQDALLTGLLPQQQPFRRQTQPQVEVMLRPTDDGDSYELALIRKEHDKNCKAYVNTPHLLHAVAPQAVRGDRISPWAADDYLSELDTLAASLGLSTELCGERFGTASLSQSDDGWRFHPALGFAKYRRR
jgi:CRISPR-associated endonuclease/helicase Cas3